jgi:hypothetical protein
MAIRFRCPSGHALSVDSRFAGKKIRCGLCGKVTVVPTSTKAARKEPSGPSADASLDMPAIAIPAAGAQAARPTLPPGLAGIARPRPARPRAGEKRPALRHRSKGERLARMIEVLRRRWWPGLRRLPVEFDQPDPQQVRTVVRLAVLLALAVILSLAPLVWHKHLDPAAAPAWARVVLLAALMQSVYIAWMVNAPDRTSVWIVALVFTSVATAYALTMAVAMATPVDHPLMLGLGEVRHTAMPWCGAMVAVMAAAAYRCGSTSKRWYR